MKTLNGKKSIFSIKDLIEIKKIFEKLVVDLENEGIDTSKITMQDILLKKELPLKIERAR